MREARLPHRWWSRQGERENSPWVNSATADKTLGQRPPSIPPSRRAGVKPPLFPIRGKGYDKEEGRMMANVATDVEIDWTACELIERVPGKVSGRPVVRGTRIMPDPIVNSYELGDSMEEIHEGFPTLSMAQIKRLIDFAHDQRKQRQP
jgi:uncharacterized protein (DUF433 family)